jgi:hypothetical protein
MKMFVDGQPAGMGSLIPRFLTLPPLRVGSSCPALQSVGTVSDVCFGAL